MLPIFIKNELNLYHKLKIDNKGVFQVPPLKIEIPKIYKAKKFACRSLKGKGVQSGIRVIYAYFEKKDKIDLIEIYYKGDKENEYRERILHLLTKRDRKPYLPMHNSLYEIYNYFIFLSIFGMLL